MIINPFYLNFILCKYKKIISDNEKNYFSWNVKNKIYGKTE